MNSGLYKPFKVCTNFRLHTGEEYHEDFFMGITLIRQMAFGRMVVLTTLILPIYEHGMSFHLLVSFSVSFFRVLKF